MRRSLLLLVVLLSACSGSEPTDTPADALTEALRRATHEVPAFGGVEFEGDLVVVYTLGPASGAEAAVRALFEGEAPTEVRTRPARGQGSESLKDDVSRLVFGALDGAQSSDYDETTGYVRLGVLSADAVRRAPGSAGPPGAPALGDHRGGGRAERGVVASGARGRDPTPLAFCFWRYPCPFAPAASVWPVAFW